MALTKDEAKALVRERGFLIPEHACEGCDHTCGEGRTLIHSLLGGIGADWDVKDVEDFIDRAESVGWSPHFMGHDLLVVGHQSVLGEDEQRLIGMRFDVPQPKETTR